MTHAFFKALLFLGAGSVIHALSDEQDLRKMGGIWKKIPATYVMMWIGSLALAGVFPFAGFYSKDMVLESAYAAGGLGKFAYWAGITAAFLTAFYSWRLLILAFHGKPRSSEEVMSHVHESPPVILIPLVLLSIGAVISGAVGYYLLGMVDADGSFWRAAIMVLPENNPLEAAHHVEKWVKFLPLGVGIAGIILAYVAYMLLPGLPGFISTITRPIYLFLLNKWYFDELYDVIFVRSAKSLGKLLWSIGDVFIVDGLGPNGVALASGRIGALVNRLQSGYVYTYALVMLLGVLVLVGWYLSVYIR
jgi:NADH-quinone oxidoreductase subunit L